MTRFLQNLKDRRSLPGLRRGIALTALLALGPAIGAARSLWARPATLAGLGRLVWVAQLKPHSTETEPLSPANYLDLQAASHSLAHLAAYQYWSANVTDPGEAEEVLCVLVTGDFFSTLDARAALGRTLLPQEQQPGRNHAAVLGDGFWRRHFAADPAVIGRTLSLDGKDYTIVGVMPRDFRFPLSGPDLWVPLALSAREKSLRNTGNLYGVGRLKPEASFEQARAEIEAIWARLAREYPQAVAGRGVSVVPLLAEIVDNASRRLLAMLARC